MTISLEFGALAQPIGEQLEKQGVVISKDAADRFDKIAHSIILLHLQDIIPDSVRNKAHEKLMKKIIAEIHRGA